MTKKTLLLIASVCGVALPAASAADITGKINLKGTAPKPADWTAMISDPNCGRQDPLLSRVYVVGENNALADVVVYIKEGVGNKTSPPVADPFVIDQQGCEYHPYIGAAQMGQKVIVKNSDKTMHNVNVQPRVAGNTASNKMQMAGMAPLEYTFEKPEEFIAFACNVHPWMKSYLTVFPHPFFAVTGEDGTFKIANLPAGKYVIEAYHRKAGKVTQEVTVGGDPVKLDITVPMPAE